MSDLLQINGTTIDRVAANLTIGRCRPWAKDEAPSFSFSRRGGPLTALPDPYLNKTVSYTLPSGTLLFQGDIQKRSTHYQPGIGWTYDYTATGTKQRGAYIPVTDQNSLTDTARFNLSPDDPYRILSRTGRTGGQIIADVLEMTQNKAALIAAGLGHYSSAGSGASASAVMVGQAVGSFTGLVGGTGYTVAPTVLLVGGGGSGATATAAVTSGAVTGLTPTAGGAGYTSRPTVILSTLPTATITDLLALNYVLPFETDVAGERILTALEGTAQVSDPNVWLHVELDGTIRFLNPFGFTATTLTIGNTGAGDPRVGLPELDRDITGCYSRVVLRGQTFVNSLLVGLLPLPGSSKTDGGLQEDFAHDGLTDAQAKTNWVISDWQQPGQPSGEATGVATVSGGAVASATVQYQGYGYASAPPITAVGGAGTGATFTGTLTSGKLTAITVTAGGSGYTSTPTLLIGPPSSAGSFDQGTCTCSSTTNVVITSSNPLASWPSNFWDQADSGKHGTFLGWSDVVSGVEQQWGARVVSNTAMTAGGTCTLTIDNPLPSLNYSAYQLTGTSGGANAVGRRYKLTDATQGAELVPFFPYPQAYRNSDGTAATLTSIPTATISISSLGNGNAPYTQSPCGISIDPESGTILLNKPAQLAYSPDNQTAVWPDNVQAFLAVANGVLSVAYPPDVSGVPQYAGTCYSVETLERTKTVSANDWKDNGNSANMLLMAENIWKSVSSTVIEGSIPYYGLNEAFLVPGLSVNIAADTYTTGLEGVAVPVTAVDLIFNEGGGTGTSYDMTFHISNRRAPYSGEAFRRPSQTGMNALNMIDQGMSLGLPSGMGADVESVMGAAAGFHQAGLEASAEASQNLPTSMEDLGINTDVGATGREAMSGLASMGHDAASGMASMGVDISPDNNTPPPMPAQGAAVQAAQDLMAEQGGES